MESWTWMLGQPLPHISMLVRRVVVHNEMNLFVGRRVFFNHRQESNPLLMTVLRMEGIDELTAAHV
jgi:ribosomal protein L35AE/L33A